MSDGENYHLEMLEKENEFEIIQKKLEEREKEFEAERVKKDKEKYSKEAKKQERRENLRKLNEEARENAERMKKQQQQLEKALQGSDVSDTQLKKLSPPLLKV